MDIQSITAADFDLSIFTPFLARTKEIQPEFCKSEPTRLFWPIILLQNKISANTVNKNIGDMQDMDTKGFFFLKATGGGNPSLSSPIQYILD